VTLKACNARLGEVVTEKHIVQLESQLEQATRSVERLVKECNELRGRQIDFEVL
jgi:chromosome segregation ATPase